LQQNLLLQLARSVSVLGKGAEAGDPFEQPGRLDGWPGISELAPGTGLFGVVTFQGDTEKGVVALLADVLGGWHEWHGIELTDRAQHQKVTLACLMMHKLRLFNKNAHLIEKNRHHS
jgi:hypothetical protein